MNNLEIERKFLVDVTSWNALEKKQGDLYLQGYLGIDEDKAIRVRLAKGKGYLTIKGRSDTCAHPEYEYEIPFSDAQELIIAYCANSVEKVRYRIPVGKHVWEVDVFRGKNEGLIVAEIELNDPEEPFERPSWVGEEVTSNSRYYNASLSQNPLSTWQK